MTDTSTGTLNREFIESYELKGDGSLADRFIANCKRAIKEEDALTPEERAWRREEYQKTMAEIITSTKNHPGYDAIFTNPRDTSDD